MANHYLVVSDLHLADIENHDDAWMAHKASRFVFDEQFAELIRSVSERIGDAKLTLVLNGDIVDFDLVTAVPDDPPWPVTRWERRRGLAPTEDKSTWKLERVLQCHPVWVKALARLLGAGHDVVYVLGNHDRELHFEPVQRALRQALMTAGRADGVTWQPEALRFEEWFYYVPGEIYVEHGQQYDHYTSFRHLLWPTVKVGGERLLALPMGNLSNRYLMSRMGYFNPHASDYVLNLFRYLGHWLRYYAFSRRSLLFNWLWGSLLVIVILVRTKKRLRKVPEQAQEQLAATAQRYGIAPSVLRKLAKLQPKPITSRMYRLLRELWFDRLVIALLMTSGTIALALVPIPLWIKLMVPLSCFPLVYFIYEQLAQGENIFTVERIFPERARQIARLLPTQVISFGHTHEPRLIPLRRDTVFVDTGTWAPVGDTKKAHGLRPGLRNYLWASFASTGRQLEFGSYDAPHDASST